jgi:hypothetical protein
MFGHIPHGHEVAGALCILLVASQRRIRLLDAVGHLVINKVVYSYSCAFGCISEAHEDVGL